jgi:hypothetical protein
MERFILSKATQRLGYGVLRVETPRDHAQVGDYLLTRDDKIISTGLPDVAAVILQANYDYRKQRGYDH